MFGALRVLPAIGFVAAAIAMLAGRTWWKELLAGIAVFSLVLTGLDWSNAFMGAITDVVILFLLLLGPRIATWFS